MNVPETPESSCPCPSCDWPEPLRGVYRARIMGPALETAPPLTLALSKVDPEGFCRGPLLTVCQSLCERN